MPTRPLAPPILLLLLLLSPSTAADPSHPEQVAAAQPAVVDAFLGWWANHTCSYEPGADCTTAGAVKAAIGLAALGVSPAHWPSEQHGVERWILAHPEDWNNLTALGPGPSLAMTILALEGAGHDADAVTADGTHRDLVAELAGHAGADGYGATNADAWALFAFNLVALDNQTVAATAQALADAQHTSGGWSWAPDQEPDPDTTAWAVTALASHDEHAQAVDDGVAYLRSHQITEGEHRACWPGVGGSASASSTSVVLGAVVATGAGEEAWIVDGQGPLDCLILFQEQDGSFRTAFEAYQTARALGGVPLGLPGPDAAPGRQTQGPTDVPAPAFTVAAALVASGICLSWGKRR